MRGRCMHACLGGQGVHACRDMLAANKHACPWVRKDAPGQAHAPRKAVNEDGVSQGAFPSSHSSNNNWPRTMPFVPIGKPWQQHTWLFSRVPVQSLQYKSMCTCRVLASVMVGSCRHACVLVARPLNKACRRAGAKHLSGSNRRVFVYYCVCMVHAGAWVHADCTVLYPPRVALHLP
jgi:hypothetical protein